MKYEIVDIGFQSPDDIDFGGYENVVIGYGEDFQDSINDACNAFFDLTNTNPLVIMLKLMKEFPEKFNLLGPVSTIDAAPVNTYYCTGIRFSL